jgi:hypothetical protein
MAITLRLQKGSSLTYNELDTNFSFLDDRITVLEDQTLDLDYNNLQNKPTLSTLGIGSGDIDFGSHKITYANVYSNLVDLPNAGTYHGMFAHVHATGKGYFAHAGNWIELANSSDIPTNLADLSNVTSTSPSSGQVLKWNGSAWAPANESTVDVPTNLADLSNVSDATPTSGQVLKWDGSQWAPGTDVAEGGAGLDADTLDGFEGTYYLDYTNFTNTPNLSTYLTSVAFADLTSTPTTLAGYGITDAFDGTYGSLTGAPSIPSALTDLGISDGTNGQVLTTDGEGSFTFTTISGIGGDYSNADVDTHLNTSSASTNEVLSWNGADYEWVSNAGDGGGEANQDAFSNVAVAGQTTVTADSTTDTLTLAAGSNITLTTSGNTVTIASTGSGGISNIVEDTTPQLGGDLDVNGNTVKYTFVIGNSGASAYTFSDAGNIWFPTTENDPVLYLRRGETYAFTNVPGSHPLEIRQSSGGSAYNTGVTNNGSSGTVTFSVPMSAPSTLYYQCIIHSGMGNTINIV